MGASGKKRRKGGKKRQNAGSDMGSKPRKTARKRKRTKR